MAGVGGADERDRWYAVSDAVDDDLDVACFYQRAAANAATKSRKLILFIIG